MLRFTGYLRAKLGRRIALLFFLCALIPIALFSTVTLVNVRSQLIDQSYERLRLLAKESTQSLMARLQNAAVDAGRLASRGPGEGAAADVAWADGIVWIGDAARPAGTRLGDVPVPAIRDSVDTEHLASGGALVRVVDDRVLLVRAARGDGPLAAVWIAISDPYLRGTRTPWNPDASQSPLPAGVELCIGTPTLRMGDCPQDLELRLAEARSSEADARRFRWTGGDGERLAWLGSVFLSRSFRTESWDLILSEPTDLALAPAREFERMYLLVTLLSLLVVPFLSQVQIRRNLEPLGKLEAGTRRIAAREFESRVDIRSGDEFELLADSFNAMADRLGRQFGALATANEIDRAILSELDAGAILETMLLRGPEALPGATVALLSSTEAGQAELWLREGGHTTRRSLDVPPDAWAAMGAGGGGPIPVPATFRSRLPTDGQWWTVPVRLEGELTAALLIGTDAALADEDEQHATQLADRLAVALSNARLISELDRLNLETITAFARAIDAKSAWTSGHSGRVTDMSLRMANEIGLDEDTIELLRRGALLHDIGKIGVPGAILDKPGKLTDEEFALMRSHTTVGADILEPITRLAPLVPIVRHHHERFDGGGYPDGLAGTDIPFLARLVSVADVFDALSSARPYRDAMPLERVIAIITADAGTAFDPEIVAAFERVVDDSTHARVDRRGAA